LKKTNCYELLEVWQQKNCWFGKVIEQPLNIYEFWHGAKFKEYQAFWDFRSQWEFPIRCLTNGCKSKFRTFLQKCLKLSQGQELVIKEYKFICPSCSTTIKNAHQFEKVTWITFL